MTDIFLTSSPTAPENEHIVPQMLGNDESREQIESNADSEQILRMSGETDTRCLHLADESNPISEDRCPPNLMEADIGHSFISTTGTCLASSKSRYSPVQKGSGISKSLCRASRSTNLEVAIDMAMSSQAKVSPRVLRSPVRKKSPIRWFPRKKTESFLERKIRMLQEKEGGKIASLDETLGAANPHLCRIEREKLAALAAAEEAMDARKNALIEASWCRILKLAGIPCNSAVLDLQKAEIKASAALSEAERLGVILQNGSSDREITSGAVTACFDTAFEVDKEVAAVIKAVLQHINQLGSCRSQESQTEIRNFVNETGVDDLFNFDFEASSSEAESQSDLEFEKRSCSESKLRGDVRPKKKKPKSPVHKSLISLMLRRITDLSPDHRTSLASIVATRGLSALLKAQSLEQDLIQDRISIVGNTQAVSENGTLDALASSMIKHVSQDQEETDSLELTAPPFPAPEISKRSGNRMQKKKQIQSLDQILVKHVSRLEKEKLAAQAKKKTDPPAGIRDQETEDSPAKESEDIKETCKSFPNERRMFSEVTNTQESKKKDISIKRKSIHKTTTEGVSDLGSILVKHVSRLEKEKEAALSKCDAPDKMIHHNQETSMNGVFPSAVLVRDEGKRNRRMTSEAVPELSSILVKHVSRLEKERMAALKRWDDAGASHNLNAPDTELSMEKNCSLHVARSSEVTTIRKEFCNFRDENTDSQHSTKIEASSHRSKNESNSFDNFSKRKSAREKQLEDEWGGLSLGNALKRHVSKLELEQAAWRQAEEEAKRWPNLQ